MKAIQYSRYGGSDLLQSVEKEKPIPGKGQCLIRVHAAGVNPIDWKLRQGMLRLIVNLSFPHVPGQDIAGEVVQLGEEVENFTVGDRVYAMTTSRVSGAYAEYAVADESCCARAPETLTFEEAAAVPLAGLTALQALRDRGDLAKGQDVLIIGASGGVGHFAVQISRAFGATVTAVSGPSNVDWVKKLGAERVFNYQKDDYRACKLQFDLIFDVVNAASYPACAHLLKENGRYVNTQPGFEILLYRFLLPFVSGKRASSVIVKPDSSDLHSLTRLIEGNGVNPHLERVFSFGEAAKAQDHVEEGHTKGKVVISIASGSPNR